MTLQRLRPKEPHGRLRLRPLQRGMHPARRPLGGTAAQDQAPPRRGVEGGEGRPLGGISRRAVRAGGQVERRIAFTDIDEDGFGLGDVVEIRGLTGAPQHNGKVGSIVS
eukprot:CAMPEP_0178669650 /NCGR_PEP_ID=MMETSP0698-20121128/32243_1 /TAXON_ID=265572 /ORGANISM="Extubocellulus spinifer, Strain CCMP396" /LENGTH=108 /DNA_ID=CAMNT_0020313331 /DNA_START=116 /DNA_END=439 /DNA_ORIENTATION=+